MFITFSVHHFKKKQQTIADQEIKEFKINIFQCSSKQERNAVLILCNIMS